MLKDFSKVFVRQLANKNQFVIRYTNDKNISLSFWAFQSYTSLIALYNPTTHELLLNNDKWDYSKTTLKHLKMFINEYTEYRYTSKLDFIKMICNNQDNIKFFN